MNITKINKLKDFGIFQSFSWANTIEEFKDYNLIYGWNYSGKTTLSRVFRSYELGILHGDCEGCKIELELADGSKITEKEIPNKLQVRVFNSDFIAENLKWNENFQPILILGTSSIQLQQLISEEKENLKLEVEKFNALSQNKKKLQEELSDRISKRAKELKVEYSFHTFDKRHFEPLINSVMGNTDDYILIEDEYKICSTKAKVNEIKNKLPILNIHILSINDFFIKIENLSVKKVDGKIIDRLKEDVELNNWVSKGLEIHESKKTCEFCEGDLKPNVLEKLRQHFSEEYKKLINEINELLSSHLYLDLKIDPPDSAKLYSELESDYKSTKKELLNEINFFNKNLNLLKQKLEFKKNHLFEIVEMEELSDNTSKILQGLTSLNSIIARHNEIFDNIEVQKQEAIEKLQLHHAGNFIKDNDLLNKYLEIGSFEKDISKSNICIKNLKNKIINIEKQISETVKGAEKINENLSQYFGKNDIRIEVTEDNTFKLLRGAIVAKNLSEGEKTAIAFAYFITKLDDKDTKLEDTIIYIDDPISSLDSNHLFNTYSFIYNKFFDFNNATRRLLCKQIFISTHNFEFLNLIKDWFQRKVNKTAKSYYLIERTHNSAKDESKILNLPVFLFKFKSEYSFLFSIIYNFDSNPDINFEYLYNLPNIVRRFLETYTAFKFLSSKDVDEKLDLLITDGVKREKVRKFMHYYSHSITTNKLIQISDLSDCAETIKIVLKSIEKNDKQHFDSLISECIVPR